MIKKTLLLLTITFLGVGISAATTTPEERLIELGIELTPPRDPVANYVNAVRIGDVLYISGKGPELPGGGMITGKLGENLSVEEGRVAARQTAINLISVLKRELGELGRVEKIIKLSGMVNASADFEQHPQVINGASDLLVQVFGKDIGKHARVAAGMSSLPFGIPVEIDLIVKVIQQ